MFGNNSDSEYSEDHLEEEAIGELDAIVGSGLDVEAVPEVRGASQHALDKFCLMKVELMTTVADSMAKFSGRNLLFLLYLAAEAF